MKPVVIGIGGAGLKVVDKIARKNKSISTIAIDITDTQEIKEIERHKKEYKKMEIIGLEYGDEDEDHLNDRLGGGKLFNVNILGKTFVLNKLESGRIYPYGIDKIEDFSVKGEGGVGRCRTKMDFLLHEKRSNFRQIYGYFTRLRSAEFGTGLHPERPEEKISFWIICGAAGGTGSCLLCGIGKIIRSIFREKCTIFVVLILPNGPTNLDYVAVANSYCLLREIEYLRNKGKTELLLVDSGEDKKVKDKRKEEEEIFREHLLKSGNFFDNITLISFKNKFDGIDQNFACRILDEDIVPTLIRCLQNDVVKEKGDKKKDEDVSENSEKNKESKEESEGDVEKDLEADFDEEVEDIETKKLEKQTTDTNASTTVGFKMNDFFKFQQERIYGTIAFSQMFVDVVRLKQYFNYKDSLEDLIRIRDEIKPSKTEYEDLIKERRSKNFFTGWFAGNLDDKIVSTERTLDNKYEESLKIKIPEYKMRLLKKENDTESIRILNTHSTYDENDECINLKIKIFTELLDKQLETIKSMSKIGVVSTYPILFEEEGRESRKFLDNKKIKKILNQIHILNKKNKLENYTLSNLLQEMDEDVDTYIDGRIKNVGLEFSSFENLGGKYDQEYPLAFKMIVAHDDIDIMRRYRSRLPRQGIDGDNELNMLHILDEESKNLFPKANWTMLSFISGYNLENSNDYIELKMRFEEEFSDRCIEHICYPEAFEKPSKKKDDKGDKSSIVVPETYKVQGNVAVDNTAVDNINTVSSNTAIDNINMTPTVTPTNGNDAQE